MRRMDGSVRDKRLCVRSIVLQAHSISSRSCKSSRRVVSINARVLVTRLVGLNASVIVVGSMLGIVSTSKVTRTIPLVMIGGTEDPVRLGLAESFARLSARRANWTQRWRRQRVMTCRRSTCPGTLFSIFTAHRSLPWRPSCAYQRCMGSESSCSRAV